MNPSIADIALTASWVAGLVGMVILAPVLLRLRLLLRREQPSIGVILVDALLATVAWTMLSLGAIVYGRLTADRLAWWIVELIALGWLATPWWTLGRLIWWRYFAGPVPPNPLAR